MQNDGSNPLTAGLFSGENKEICFRGLGIFYNDVSTTVQKGKQKYIFEQ